MTSARHNRGIGVLSRRQVPCSGLTVEEAKATVPSVGRLRDAITQGVTYLERAQLPHGEFRVYWYEEKPVVWVEAGGIRWHRAREWRFDSTPFGTGNLLYSLSFVPDHRVDHIAQRAISFLLSEMEPPGLWRYWSSRNPRHHKILVDLDDTSVVGLSLLIHGVEFVRDLDLLMRARTEEKLFVTWIRSPDQPTTRWAPLDAIRRGMHRYYAKNTPDCVVNAQMLAYVTHQGRTLPEVCAYLTNIIVQGDDPTAHSLYYHLSPYGFTSAVSKAYAEGAACLQPAVEPLIAFVTSRREANGSWGNALTTAQAAITLLNLGYHGEALDAGIRVLLSQQQRDGGWPREKYWGTTMNLGTAFGSQELTTGFALEALGKYLQRQTVQP